MDSINNTKKSVLDDEEALLDFYDEDDITFNNGTTTLTLKQNGMGIDSTAELIINDNNVEQNGGIIVADDDEQRLEIGLPLSTPQRQAPPRTNSSSVAQPVLVTSSMDSSSNNSSGTRTQRLTLGIIILILVDIIWVASSELTEYIFHDQQFNKPFFSSYVKTSMFLVFLTGFICWTPWHDQCWLDFGAGRNTLHQHAYRLLESETEFQSDSNSRSTQNAHEIIDNNANESALSAPSFVQIYDINSGYETDDSSTQASLANQRSVRFSKLAEVRQLNESEANEALFARLSYQASLQAELIAKRLASRFNLPQTAQLSLMFCLMWFVAAYCYQLAISNTEAGIVNLLSSSSSFFTLILAAIFPSNIGDKFTLSKFLAVLISFGGVMIVTLSDLKLEENSVPFGAVFALISAFFYACYLVFLKRKVQNEDKLDMMMFFGFVGLFNLLLLWPVFFLLSYLNIESFEWPNHKQWMYLILNGFIGTVFAEVLWLWGCFLTSSLIATLAVSLTIPLSMIADIMYRHISYSSSFYLGSIPMVLSFAAVALLSHYENWDPLMEFFTVLKRRMFTSGSLATRRRRGDIENRYQRLSDKDASQRESLIGNLGNEEDDDEEEEDCLEAEGGAAETGIEESDYGSTHSIIKNGQTNSSSILATACETYSINNSEVL